MAQQLTAEQLQQRIREATLSVIKETLPTQVRDAVRENLEASLAPLRKQQTDWMEKILARGSGGGDEPRKRGPGEAFARFVRAIALAKISGTPSPEAAMKFLKEWGDEDLAKTWEGSRTKALAAGDASAGGFLVPTQFSQDVIELMRPAATVRSLNPVVLPMPTGTVQVPKITAGATASYIGENTNIPKTEPSFGQITLTWKKLAALVPVSNNLLRYSSPGADSIVRDDVVRALAAREDRAFIRDDGTSATPKGLKFWIDAANKFNATAAVTLDGVTTDLGRAIQNLMDADVPLIISQGAVGAGSVDVRPGWIFSPRTYRYLSTVRTTNGPYAFRDEMLTGRLWGWPFRVTSQVLSNMGSGGNQSEVYFGGFAFAVIGESQNLMVDVSQEAAYDDGGTVRAAFSLDQTVVRVLSEHDFALRQDRGFSLIQAVTWSA